MALPGPVGQLPVERGAPWDSGGLLVLKDLLALQPVRALGGRPAGQRLIGWGGHAVPGGVPLEGRLILAGRALAVQLILHHGDAIELRTAPERETEREREREISGGASREKEKEKERM